MTNEPSDVVRRTGRSVNAPSNSPYPYLNATPVLKLEENHQYAMSVCEDFFSKTYRACLPKGVKMAAPGL